MVMSTYLQMLASARENSRKLAERKQQLKAKEAEAEAEAEIKTDHFTLIEAAQELRIPPQKLSSLYRSKRITDNRIHHKGRLLIPKSALPQLRSEIQIACSGPPCDSLTTDEVARELNVTRSQINRMYSGGLIQDNRVRWGHSKLIARSDVPKLKRAIFRLTNRPAQTEVTPPDPQGGRPVIVMGKSLAEWAKELGVSHQCVSQLRKRGRLELRIKSHYDPQSPCRSSGYKPTPRFLRIVALLINGIPHQQIALECSVYPDCVENIYRLLGEAGANLPEQANGELTGQV